MSPKELFDEAVRLEEDDQQELALAVWREIAEIRPTRDVFLRLGRITKKLGLIEDAEHAFKRALELDGRSALALRCLGHLEMDRRAFAAAQGYLKRACDLEEDPGGFSVLGVALESTGQQVEAEEAYRKAIRIDPGYEEAYYNLGVLLRSDRPSEAQAPFRTAIELDLNYARAYRELGFILSKLGRNAETESHLRKAIELEPRDAWTHIYLGNHLWKCSNVEAATAELRTAQELEPEWAAPLWCLGNIYECELADFDLAESFYQRALQLEPDNEQALHYLGRLSRKRGQTPSQ